MVGRLSQYKSVLYTFDETCYLLVIFSIFRRQKYELKIKIKTFGNWWKKCTNQWSSLFTATGSASCFIPKLKVNIVLKIFKARNDNFHQHKIELTSFSLEGCRNLSQSSEYISAHRVRLLSRFWRITFHF